MEMRVRKMPIRERQLAKDTLEIERDRFDIETQNNHFFHLTAHLHIKWLNYYNYSFIQTFQTLTNLTNNQIF